MRHVDDHLLRKTVTQRDEAARWRDAAWIAGDLLAKWFWRHPVILKKIAPIVPEISDVLKSRDITKIELLLNRAAK